MAEEIPLCRDYVPDSKQIPEVNSFDNFFVNFNLDAAGIMH